ncbi:MAG: ATP-binding protein [Thermodesulfobacteriota bacterium]
MGWNRSLLWQVFPSYVLVIVVSLLVEGYLAKKLIDDVSRAQTVEDLTSSAVFAAKLFDGRLSPAQAQSPDTLCKELGSAIRARITIIDAKGQVLGESETDPERMESHVGRPEVRDALQGRVGASERYSFTLGKTMTYVAVPVEKEGRTAGIVRVAAETRQRSHIVGRYFEQLAVVGVLIALLAAGLSFYISYRVSRPVREMALGARRFSQGDLYYRLEPAGSEEFAALAEAMNRMAEQLNDRIAAITRQKVELETILSGMVEAVFVVDPEQRLVRVNRAAELLFSITAGRIQGKRFHEIVRNTDLHKFVSRTLDSQHPLEAEIVFLGDQDRFLQAYGCPLEGSQGKKTGALLVLHDVTRLKNLEKMRRDFVANVSHELNTPVTSIKGFLETLREGALREPENAERFLDIAIKHTDRLGRIIRDLLSLSRIERDTEKGEIARENAPLGPLGEAVYRACGESAAAKGISLDFQCPANLEGKVNLTLLEQALVNLVDNAIKYSGPGSAVSVTVAQADGEIAIRVQDQGCGISKEHLSRLFERFYRVDKGRSRREGGTGLGLAIVKHIVNAHNGRITVESLPGRGSTFTVYIPAAS